MRDIPSDLLRHLVLRGATIWLALRMAVAIVLALAGEPPLELGVVARLWMLPVTAAVAYAATRRQGETVLLANLAVSPALIASLFALPALLGEVALAAWFADAGRRP